MQKPALIRAIYAEIRKGVPELPAGEALDMAHRLFRAYVFEADQMKGFGQEVESRSVGRLPLDEAIRDGGWRVLDYELHRASEVDDLDSATLAAIRPLIERFLGPEWQHHSQVRPL